MFMTMHWLFLFVTPLAYVGGTDVCLDEACSSDALNMLQLQAHPVRDKELAEEVRKDEDITEHVAMKMQEKKDKEKKEKQSRSALQDFKAYLRSLQRETLEAKLAEHPGEAIPRHLHPRSSFFRELEKAGARQGLEEGVHFIVPGLASYDRARLIQHNLEWLKDEGVPFECTIYVYLTEEEFPLHEKDFEPCVLVRHPGFWMDHLKAFPLNETRRRWVAHMVDSIEPQENVKLGRMLEIMTTNNLSHAAPTFQQHTLYPVMTKHNETKPGRKVGFIELQLDVMSRDYFACMQDIASDENGLGWGMDLVLNALCNGTKGLIDEMTVIKRFHGSYDYGAAARSMKSFLDNLRERYPGLFMGDTQNSYGALIDPLDANASLVEH